MSNERLVACATIIGAFVTGVFAIIAVIVQVILPRFISTSSTATPLFTPQQSGFVSSSTSTTEPIIDIDGTVAARQTLVVVATQSAMPTATLLPTLDLEATIAARLTSTARANIEASLTLEALTPHIVPTVLPTNQASSRLGIVQGYIRWNDSPLPNILVELYSRECSADPQWGELLFSVESDQNGFYRFTDLEPGPYRVGVNGWSTVEGVEPYPILCSGNPFSLGAGEIREINWDLPKTDLLVTNPLEGSTEGERPVFSWRAYPGAEYYEVSIFQNDSSFRQVFMHRRTNSTSMTSLIDLGIGSGYYGWVYAYNTNGTAIASGDFPNFSVR